MGLQQRNLNIVFRCIQPERLYESISRRRGMSGWNTEAEKTDISVSKISSAIFHTAAHAQYPWNSYEELEGIYQTLLNHMRPVLYTDIGSNSAPSVIHLLIRMGQRVLYQLDGDLVCRFSEMLTWYDVYHWLGQDIFTTAYLAWEDLRHGINRNEFLWDAIIKTDHHSLRGILRQGVAENHCHLGGTTQSFPLSWACMMNYPRTIKIAAKKLRRNLQSMQSRGASDNVWTWERRLLWAAYLREKLFTTLYTPDPQNAVIPDMDALWFEPFHKLCRELETLRFSCGASVEQPDRTKCVLDYALREADCKYNLLENHNRLLSGERNFLYRCFRACLDGSLSAENQDWFYLYLLIKENFRSEMIQTNEQFGFHNFKEYQDRKETIYKNISGYNAEMVRLAVNANQESQHIVSFELRMAPANTSRDLYTKIRQMDRQIKFAGDFPEGNEHFYVLHFIKTPESAEGVPKDGDWLARPRNFVARVRCQKQAKALAHLLRQSQYTCSRVLGIDAASTEIGCRPEVFAVQFRYLRDLPPVQHGGFLHVETLPRIHATYHAGEDFMDMADGLRAVDEAMCFLDLRQGDRIGHALALGVEPEIHYQLKRRRVVLSKQDCLDNFVWLIYRSRELGLDLEPGLRAALQTRAETLLMDIYGSCIRQMGFSVSLREYYCSMSLRGDAPDIYYILPYREPAVKPYNLYWQCRRRLEAGLEEYRKSETIAWLYHCYHYNEAAKERGREIMDFEVNQTYIRMIQMMQDKLMLHLANRGIMIECNPTSNYLIGTFRKYEQHPIFRFYNTGLAACKEDEQKCAQISVSINTDDLGIFDTSIENEYAILAAGIGKVLDEQLQQRFSNSAICQYLNNVRKMGLDQSFLRGHHNPTVSQLLESPQIEQELAARHKAAPRLRWPCQP